MQMKKPPSLFKIIALHKQETLEEFLKFHQDKQQELAPFIQLMQNKKQLVSAEDLKQIGIPAGPKMGSLLQEGMRYAINHRCQDPKIILAHLQYLDSLHQNGTSK